MTSTIRRLAADSPEYTRDYNNGWRVSQRCDEGALASIFRVPDVLA